MVGAAAKAERKRKYCVAFIVGLIVALLIATASFLLIGMSADSNFNAESGRSSPPLGQDTVDVINGWINDFDWNVIIPSDLLVGVYYYPWHSDDFHRGQGYLRQQLQPIQEPELGEYDDTDPAVVAQHLDWSRQANIQLWVASWWGPTSREDSTIRNSILNHPHLGTHKIALFYESTGRIKKKEGYTVQRVFLDIQHACKEYFDHPNYLKVDDRPVMFMYLTRLLEQVGVLERTVNEIRRAASECGRDIYLVGDHTFRRPPSLENEYYAFKLLDAVTTYDVYGGMAVKELHAGQEVVDSYYKKQLEWRSQAIAQNCSYIPAASAGFNDLGVRPEVEHLPLSRRLTAEDTEGSLFRATLEKATRLVDSATGSIVMVNSFNEWHEDSQIEPAKGETTTSPPELTHGLEYEGYGEIYLDILRNCTSRNSTCT